MAGYACNTHVRALKRSLEQNNFPAEWKSVLTTRLAGTHYSPHLLGNESGSETLYSEPHLRHVLEAVASVVNTAVGKPQLNVEVVNGDRAAKSGDFVLAKPSSRPEPVLWCDSKKAFVVASEAKGCDADVSKAYAQVFHVTGDGALELLRCGLKREDCVVFGVVSAGVKLQLVATFLLPEYYPCMAAVSEPVSYKELRLRPALVSLLCALAEAAVASVERLDQPVPDLRQAPKPAMLLASSKLFMKPVQAAEPSDDQVARGALQSGTASHVLYMFELLDLGGALEHVCSPLGMVSMPPETKSGEVPPVRKTMMASLGHGHIMGVCLCFWADRGCVGYVSGRIMGVSLCFWSDDGCVFMCLVRHISNEFGYRGKVSRESSVTMHV